MSNPNVNYYFQRQLGVEFIYVKDKSIYYPEHNHVSNYTVGMVLCGEVRLKKGNQLFGYGPGTMFVVAPYEVHTIYAEKSCSMLTVCISMDFINAHRINDAKLILGNFFVKLSINDTPGLNGIEWLHDGLEFIYKYSKDQVKDKVDEYIGTVKQYIRDHPESNLSLEQISQIVHMSKYHLVRKFKKEIGLTPHKFQIQNQVRKAQILLGIGSSVADAASAAGFYDQSHFIKRFKNIVGMTPTEYKRSSIQLVNTYDARLG